MDGNMVTNVYTKTNYDRLRIDIALGFWKSDNSKKKKHKNKKSKNNLCIDWGPVPGPKRHRGWYILGTLIWKPIWLRRTTDRMSRTVGLLSTKNNPIVACTGRRKQLERERASELFLRAALALGSTKHHFILVIILSRRNWLRPVHNGRPMQFAAAFSL